MPALWKLPEPVLSSDDDATTMPQLAALLFKKS